LSYKEKVAVFVVFSKTLFKFATVFRRVLTRFGSLQKSSIRSVIFL